MRKICWLYRPIILFARQGEDRRFDWLSSAHTFLPLFTIRISARRTSPRPKSSTLINTMVSRGFSKAAAILALGLGASAFIPSKLTHAPSRTVGSSGIQKLEGCDAVLKRMEGKVS
jgi:hypothetical protein